MAKPDIYNFEISDENFDKIVLTNSHKLPVFVLFMSPTVSACVSLESTLINYATQFAGEFILARLDIDMYPEAAKRFDIENIPTLRVYKDSTMQHQEVGLMTHEYLAEVLRQFAIFDPSEDLRLEALEKHQNGETPEAIQLLTQAIQMNPKNVNVAMDMCQVFLDINLLEQAASLFTKLPDRIKEEDTPRYLIGQITFKKLAMDTEGTAALTQQLTNMPDDVDTQFYLAICLMADQKYQEGMEQLFNLLKADKNAKGGAVKELAIGTLKLLDLKHQTLAASLRQTMNSIVSS